MEPSPVADDRRFDRATNPALIAARVRRRVLGHALEQGGGYLSQACSSAEILATLYARLMRLGPSIAPPVPAPFAGPPGATNPRADSGAGYNGPRGPELDRFFFSPAHYALVLYATLVETGRLDERALEQFNRDGSRVELIAAEHSPGIEAMPGSLPQALSQAAGVAFARRLRGDTGRTWVFMSDGEFQEGQAWEAVAALGFHRIAALTILVDVNGYQCDGAMGEVMRIEPFADRLRAFGAAVVEVDGHDVEALTAAAAQPHEERPLVVLGRTDACRGMEPLRERVPKLHYVRFRDATERARYRALLETWKAC
jgi:transketolase